MNKNYKRICVFVCYMIFIFAGFAYGYFKGKDIGYANDEITKKQDELSGINNIDKTVIQQEVKVTPSTTLEYICYYSECNHSEKEVKRPNEKMVGMNEEEFMEYLTKTDPRWEMLVFNSDRIILSMTKAQLCPEHFIIGINDDKITVYKIDDLGEKVLYRVVNSSLKLLKKVDQEKLLEGIVVDSEEEMIKVLENFSS